MALRIPRPALTLGGLLVLSFLPAWGAEAPAKPSILVAYSFDDEPIETGPDTFTVFQHAKGTVRLSEAFRWSGQRSLEIRDAAGDHDFPELLGPFPLRRTGRLAVHFALMVATPAEPFNIALAGPERFGLRRDGIAFWLQTRDGYLFHVSDSIPKRLFQLRAFTWYFVDADIDLDAGRYDLRIAQEGESAPLVDLHAQANAAHQAGSAVEVFSFIGDLEDSANATYYVDDLVLGTDRAVVRPPFVAPGRRRLFAESLGDLRRLEEGRLTCLPIVSPADFGLDDAALRELKARNALQPLLDAVSGVTPAVRDAAGSPLEAALLRWREGCQALERGEAARAYERFEAAEKGAPGAPMLALSKVLAEIARGRPEGAAALLEAIPAEGLDPLDRNAPRRALLEALLLARSGEWGAAQAKVQTPSPLLASARYHLELWQERFGPAQSAALEELKRATTPQERVLWNQRAGDAALLGRDLDAAQRYYEAALGETETPDPILCRLADLRFLRGDLKGERELRERVYGSLRLGLPLEMKGIPAADHAFLDRAYDLVQRATRAKVGMLHALAEADGSGAYLAYVRSTRKAQHALEEERVPEGLARFRADVVAALELQITFFQKAVEARRAGGSYQAVFEIGEGRTASIRLQAAFSKVAERYAAWTPAVRDRVYHSLCALDLF